MYEPVKVACTVASFEHFDVARWMEGKSELGNLLFSKLFLTTYCLLIMFNISTRVIWKRVL